MIHNSYDFADSNSVVKLAHSKNEAYLSIVPGKFLVFLIYLNEIIQQDSSFMI